MKKNQVYLNRKMVDEINEYLTRKNRISDSLTKLLYRREIALEDTLTFLQNDFNGYLEKRLDKFTISDAKFYDGISFFVQTCFSYDSEIEKVVFFSFDKKRLTFWDKYGGVSSVMDIESGGDNIEESCLALVEGENPVNGMKRFRTLAHLRKPSNLKDIGLFIVQFELDGIKKIIDKYENINNRIIITDREGKVKYDSEGLLLDHYAWEGTFKNAANIEGASEKSGITILGILPNKSIINESKAIIFLSINLSLFIMGVSIWLIYQRVRGISKRTENILAAMEAVREGEFNLRVHDVEKDEISLIAQNFNEMCSKLQNYVNRAYLSEIKQKNAQLLAMESQINPHFLYNTLEAIRMKALINGDREVSSMLYSMAAIYRNITKGERLISLRKELELCKLYLELFKIRFQGKFNYSINISEGLERVKIIKLSLQPLIENYVIHGMRKDSKGNELKIRVNEENGDIVIEIEDNGYGIEKRKLESIKRRLVELEESSSLGLINVQERIKLTYGEAYGIYIDSIKDKGTWMRVKIPKMEVEE